MTEPSFEAMIAGWTAGTHAPRSDSDALPPHHDHCLGCGQDNPHGHHLVVRRAGDLAVTAEHRFDERHVGAPGIAHGGAVATVLDDLYGFLLYSIGDLAVTRELQVEYLRPVRLNRDYRLRAAVDARVGRGIQMSATLETPEGRVTATSRALFVAVGVEHFKAHGNGSTSL